MNIDKIKPIKKRVTKSEFDKFIAEYPRKLTRDIFGACEPPFISYNDFQVASMWPESVVASTHLYEDHPGDYYYEPEEKRDYFIVENYEELFEQNRRMKGVAV